MWLNVVIVYHFQASLHALRNFSLPPPHQLLLEIIVVFPHTTTTAIIYSLDCKLSKSLKIFCFRYFTQTHTHARWSRRNVKITMHVTWKAVKCNVKELWNVSWLVKWGGNHFKFSSLSLFQSCLHKLPAIPYWFYVVVLRGKLHHQNLWRLLKFYVHRWNYTFDLSCGIYWL